MLSNPYLAVLILYAGAFTLIAIGATIGFAVEMRRRHRRGRK